jgi:hypothetical protein
LAPWSGCAAAASASSHEVSNVLPGWMRAEEPVYSNPRAEQKVRQIR